jgi:arylformamidase
VAIDLFRTRDHVPAFDAIVREYAGRSAAARADLRMAAGLRYGDGTDETLDLFFPAGARPGMPVHMFIHGGYWRMFSKGDFSYVAETVTRAGAIAAIVDYSLMPAVRMDRIVEQVRAAKRWLLMNARAHGGDPAKLTVSGHSAGAHLAAMLFTRDEAPSGVRGALLLSGVYDLAPLQSSFLAPLIGITDAEVGAFSPLTRDFEAGVDVAVLHGERETTPFHAQAAALAARLERQGCRVSPAALTGADHMSAARDLGVPESAAGRMLTALIRRSDT